MEQRFDRTSVRPSDLRNGAGTRRDVWVTGTTTGRSRRRLQIGVRIEAQSFRRDICAAGASRDRLNGER